MTTYDDYTMEDAVGIGMDDYGDHIHFGNKPEGMSDDLLPFYRAGWILCKGIRRIVRDFDADRKDLPEWERD